VLSVALAALLVLGACERREPPATAQSSSEYTPIGAAPGAPAVLAPFTIVCLGDSITAGYGLPEDRSYPALLQARLKAQGLPHRVVNAGVSGDTSAGGLARMDWILKQRVDVLLVALGGNDGLRGLAPEQMERNLAAIVEKGQAAGAKVVLAGMRMPTNYGEDYRRRFEAVYPALARRYGVPLLPFLLDGVGMNPRFNQPDGIHPTAEGAKIVESNVWQVLAPLLRKP
jgi:acyl-CoA thioesterase-1